jgi:HSP20 family protein
MSPTKQSWKGRKLIISAVNASDQARRMHEAVALRAYQIYESRGRVPGQELEDWRRAESEIVKPLSYGFLSLGNKLSLKTDASLFQEGEVEICIEPHRLAICGKERASKGESTPGVRDTAARAEVFHIVDLPIDIDPLRVSAKFNGACLEIDLPYARRLESVGSVAHKVVARATCPVLTVRG